MTTEGLDSFVGKISLIETDQTVLIFNKKDTLTTMLRNELRKSYIEHCKENNIKIKYDR